MRYDINTITQRQSEAFQRLTAQQLQTNEGVIPNDFYVEPKRITAPTYITQEIPYVNTSQSFVFDFSINQTKPSSNLNNSTLTLKQTACCYGIRFRIGYGDSANSRYYRTYGPTKNDDAIYNGRLSWKFESDEYVTGVDMSDFYENTPNIIDGTSGLVLIAPMRLFKGNQGENKVTISLNNSLSAMTLTSGLYLQISLAVVLGQVQG